MDGISVVDTWAVPKSLSCLVGFELDHFLVFPYHATREDEQWRGPFIARLELLGWLHLVGEIVLHQKPQKLQS